MMRNTNRNRRAFTLIELIAAIVIAAILASVGVVKLRDHREKTKVNTAIMDLQAMQLQIAVMDPLPASLAEIGRAGALDPWGNPYEYLRFDSFKNNGDPIGSRKDRNLHPINVGFDLYSKGKDGASTLPLTAGPSRDDVIVANDGKYVGLASGY